VASSWFLFFSYHNDAQSNKHQVLIGVRVGSTLPHWTMEPLCKELPSRLFLTVFAPLSSIVL